MHGRLCYSQQHTAGYSWPIRKRIADAGWADSTWNISLAWLRSVRRQMVRTRQRLGHPPRRALHNIRKNLHVVQSVASALRHHIR